MTLSLPNPLGWRLMCLMSAPMCGVVTVWIKKQQRGNWSIYQARLFLPEHYQADCVVKPNEDRACLAVKI